MNWELYREFCIRDGGDVPRPWLKLSKLERSRFRDHCLIDYLGKTEAVVLAPLLFGARNEFVDGVKVTTSQVVTLPEFLIDWQRADLCRVEAE